MIWVADNFSSLSLAFWRYGVVFFFFLVLFLILIIVFYLKFSSWKSEFGNIQNQLQGSPGHIRSKWPSPKESNWDQKVSFLSTNIYVVSTNVLCSLCWYCKHLHTNPNNMGIFFFWAAYFSYNFYYKDISLYVIIELAKMFIQVFP